MSMLTLLIGAIVLNLPFSFPLGLVFFYMTRWGLQIENQKPRMMVRFVLLLCTNILLLGIAYGILRFSGAIIFVDEAAFCRWFHAGWQNDGFKYFYWCGAALLGILTAHFARLKGAQYGRKGDTYSE